jgi:hypothetical protein
MITWCVHDGFFFITILSTRILDSSIPLSKLNFIEVLTHVHNYQQDSL